MSLTSFFRACRRAVATPALFATLFATFIPVSAGQENAVATCTAAAGVLMAKTSTGWRPVAAGKPAPLETPLVSLFDSTLRSANGAVEVRLVADPGQRGPLPILESGVILHAAAEHDLALTPSRGLIVLTNLKKEGAATVLLTSRGDKIAVTLKEPGTKLALEIYSRHAPGIPKLHDAKEDDPVMHLFLIALKGEVLLHGKERGVTLHAPPGPAVLVWDSLLREPEVQRLEELPPELALVKQDQKLLDGICKWAKTLADESPSTVRKEGANSKSDLQRRAAVTAMGALDDLPALFEVLAGSKHADARERAVLVLRHWLGREPGQTAKLYAGLQKAGYSAVQAHNLLQLLYGFTPEQRGEPNTYDLLIDELKSDRPAMRALAHWHLVRLAPAGKPIVYDPQAPAADRDRAYEEWRKLIPPGKLPPSTTAP
jgi:hypothetical protein